jgi:neurobeachin-like protein 1/2
METRGQFSNEQSEKSLSHLWNQFVSSQNNKEKFTEYLKAFTRCYSCSINADFNLLDSERFNTAFRVDVAVPDELLPSLKYRLLTCAEEKLVSEQQIQDAILLVQSVVIISRNSRTRELVASTDFIKHVLLICDTALDRVCSKESRDHQLLLSFVHFSLHFLECLYDPSFKWRLSLTEQNQESLCKPASLDMHIVPFIYECFQRTQLDTGIQQHLLHLFGAIISGSQVNSLKAICPATVDILMRVLQSTADQYSSGDDGTDHVQRLTSLILRCLVTTIHAIHQATPEERQVEVGAVLDSYFQVLLKFCDSNNNISLQLTMLEMVETMFSVSDKSSLQNTFMASGICRQLLSFIRAIRRCPLHCQSLSTATIRVFGLLLANSTTAKEKFIQMIGYDNFFEALRNLGQPTRQLLISLLELVSERKLTKDDIMPGVKNSPVAIMLVKWLPDVDLELQSWLSTSLYQMCTADTWSLTQCCNSGINSAILECLQKRDTLDTNTVGMLKCYPVECLMCDQTALTSLI